MSEKNKLTGAYITSNVLWRLAERIGAQGVNFIVTVVLSRILTPEDYGVISLTMIFTTILSVFMTSGMGTALIQKNEIDELDCSTALFSNLAFGFLLYGIIFFLSPFLAAFFHQPRFTPIMRVLSVTLIIGGLNCIQHAKVARAMRFKLFFKATLTGTLVSAVVGIYLARRGFGPWALVAQHLTNQVIDTIFLWFMLRWRPKLQFSFARLKPMLRFGSRAYGAALIETTYNQLRSLLIGRYYSGTDLAFYNKGRHIPAMVNQNTNNAIQSVMFPAYAKVSEDPSKMKQLMKRAMSMGTFIIFPCMIGLAMVSEPLIDVLYTAKWLPSVPFLRIACIVYALTPMHLVNLQAVLAIGKSQISLRNEIIKKSIAVTTMIICVQFSLMATAVSAIPLGLFALIINAWPVGKHLKYPLWEQISDAFPALWMSAVMGVCVWLLGKLPVSNPAKLVLQVPAGVISYCLMSKLSRNKDYAFSKNYALGFIKKIIRKGKGDNTLVQEEKQMKEAEQKEEDAMTLADREHCTGCGACKEICPKQAIEFRDDAEGFPAPFVLEDKCVNCGLCSKVCPALHMPERKPIQKAYAAQIKDKEALKESTSGGLFTALAREIFRRGGLVYGCVWDDKYNAVVMKAENEEQMKPMRGSKYVWSWAGDTFPEIKAYLEEGRTVLFSGLPCQVAGLKNYLHKDYDNLYLVDFLCSGAPSPLALHSWLKTIRPSEDFTGLDLKFRDKDPYGIGVHISYAGKKGKPKGEHISNPYYYSFYTRLIDRKACFHCPYGTDQRISDLTVCDYWGIAGYHKEMNISAGVSALMVNSDRGASLLETVKGALELVETRTENIAKANNLSVGQVRKRVEPPFRDAFFATMKAQGWKAAERKYLYTGHRLMLWFKTMIPAKYVVKLKKILRR